MFLSCRRLYPCLYAQAHAEQEGTLFPPPPLAATAAVWHDPKPGGAFGSPPAAASLKERAVSWPEELHAPRKENSARVRACMIACCLMRDGLVCEKLWIAQKVEAGAGGRERDWWERHTQRQQLQTLQLST